MRMALSNPALRTRYDELGLEVSEPDPAAFETAYADGGRASISQIVERARPQEVTA